MMMTELDRERAREIVSHSATPHSAQLAERIATALADARAEGERSIVVILRDDLREIDGWAPDAADYIERLIARIERKEKV
jgi:hypothetical protein